MMNTTNLWPRLGVSAGALTVAVVLAFGSGDSDDSTVVQVNPPEVIEVSTPEVSAPYIPPEVDAPEVKVVTPSAPEATEAAEQLAADVEEAVGPSGRTSATVNKRSGTTLVLTVSDVTPQQGATVQLTKLVSKKMFGADIKATLNIGVARVKSVSGEQVTLEIIEEQSTIVIDGKKTEHFKPQASIDLAW
jgi:hypothetical protein